MLVHHFTEFYARSYPDNIGMSLAAKKLTNREIGEQTNRLANAMLALGVQPGERVSILGENSIEHALLFVAASKIGAVAVPLNYRLAPAELGYILGDSEAKLLIVLDTALEQRAPLSAHLPDGIEVISSSSEDKLPLDEWLAKADTTMPQIDVDRDAPFFQLYTSGTTGKPKGVVLSQSAIVQGLILGVLGAVYRPDIDSAVIVMAPFFHIGGAGSLISAMIQGQHCIVHETFNPIQFLDDIENNPVETIFAVPAMLMFILQIPGIEKRDFSGLKQISYGAAPISEPLLRQAMDVFQCNFTQLYGMTETAGFGVSLVQNDHLKALDGELGLLRSCGRSSIGASIKVMDDNGNEVAPGETGEIWLKSTANMLEYYNLPEATTKELTDGWVHTGDAGYKDEEGYLYLKDRIKDMVVTGGENVYPTEVENVLVHHPSVVEVAVVGVPDEKYGEALLAVVVLAPDQSLELNEMIDFCREKIAGYKIPRQLKVIDALPRNASGKVLKKDIRAPYWEGKERGIG